MKRDEIISEIDTQIEYSKFINTNAVVLSSKAAQFCLEHAQLYEQKIKELTEENERLRAHNETLEISNKDFKYRIYELSRDNEEWEHENNDLECDNDMLRERITEIKTDTVRKMQERLTTFFANDDHLKYNEVDAEYINEQINKIINEFWEGKV